MNDKRMTWKQHITSAEAKARRKMNIMRKLAGTKWGANEKILKSVYQGNRECEESSSCFFSVNGKYHCSAHVTTLSKTIGIL
jgi:hypothetical protein